ncbi:hypothetical protein [Promicromonospora sp. NPDC057488]|uniref:hypothetical protein n=1 Tax=Promicromonospora sp. NPDC057488 TaxID=3346147 RepID=UPI00367210BA
MTETTGKTPAERIAELEKELRTERVLRRADHEVMMVALEEHPFDDALSRFFNQRDSSDPADSQAEFALPPGEQAPSSCRKLCRERYLNGSFLSSTPANWIRARQEYLSCVLRCETPGRLAPE